MRQTNLWTADNMRSVEEWIGKTDDDKIPERVRVRVYMRYDGRCSCCDRLILVGEPWDIDHKIALANGGQHRESNLALILRDHHRTKTRYDQRTKARISKRQKSHLSLKQSKRPLPGSKASGWKKKMDGTVVKR